MAKPNRETVSDWQKEIEGVSTPADVPNIAYPRMQFISGKNGIAGHWREHGVFFIPDDQDIKSSWHRVEFITDNGTGVDGAVRQDIELTVIRIRRAWFVQTDDSVRRFPWDRYDAAKRYGTPSSKVQIVCAVKDVEGLVSLSLNGLQASYSTSKDGWGFAARKFLYDPVARILHGNKPGRIERLPALQFRIVIGSEVTDSGKPVYTQVGSVKKSSITRIVLKNPSGPIEAEDIAIGGFIVPRVIRESYEVAYNEAQAWFDEWSEEKETENFGGNETNFE